MNNAQHLGAPRLNALIEPFLAHGAVEGKFAPQTVSKYRECLVHVSRIIGDLPVTEYSKDHVLSLKTAMLAKGHSVGRQLGMLASLKGLLEFCRQERGLPVLAGDSVTLPKRPRREVSYLTPAEVDSFICVIDVENRNGKPFEAGLRFRALVEGLLGSAMRISELLSLNKTDINFTLREATVIGKGNKQRTVFFTDRALSWIGRYLATRTDTHPAVFVTQGGRSRLDRGDIWRPFARYRKLAQIPKRVTPHLLRHTAATQLLFNGCPIGHIKEILGHERLETTCRYYLGLDHRAAKAAHQRFLVYGQPEAPIPSLGASPLIPNHESGSVGVPA